MLCNSVSVLPRAGGSTKFDRGGRLVILYAGKTLLAYWITTYWTPFGFLHEEELWSQTHLDTNSNITDPIKKKRNVSKSMYNVKNCKHAQTLVVIALAIAMLRYPRTFRKTHLRD